jgi:hypothetical protein
MLNPSVAMGAGYGIAMFRWPTKPHALMLVLVAGLSRFVPSAFINRINCPGWAVLPFIMLYALSPFSLRLLKVRAPRDDAPLPEIEKDAGS